MKRFMEVFSKTSVASIACIIIIIGSFILLYLMMIKPIPVENKDIVLTATGFVLGGALGGATGYLFASSFKSKTQPPNEN